ncbi:hypothetical protein RCOM_0442120 [Ricinus communis]|uniref:Shugoshin C-terminal domain-containing protein n=1 Tax=Ricinus communis TaxID=3988 RepID=B9T3F8_RICCO|nr:hypothetical protein RCOM_0442120 [Ricinus communis]
MKGDEKAKGFTVVGNMPRKKLGDISNLPQKNQDMRPPSVSLNTKDYIHKLHQENLTLVKLIADRNLLNSKIIQSHALELQKSRTQCQQVQEKNLELARLNSQMLAELNSNKDRAEKKADNKRLCSRKQSARFESQEQVQEPTEDSFQINDAKFPVSSLYEHGPTSSVSAVKVEPEAAYSASGPEAQELRRSSFRPKRQVADKVQSYKEIPLNVKMRRPH